MSLIKKLQHIFASRWYWIAMTLFGIAMLSVALFYQYILGKPPCLICIHVRVWVTGLILVAIAALILHRFRFTGLVCHVLATITMAGGLERSWYLLGVERGTIISDCGPYATLPAWIPLDGWWPWMYAVWEACGKTPVMPLGFTMAEVLLVLFAVLVLISMAGFIFSLRRLLQKTTT